MAWPECGARALALWVATLGAAWAQSAVVVPSADPAGGPAIELRAFWYAAAAAGPRPALLLLHGCDGALNRRGEPSARMRDYATLLNAEGWHALVLDSLGARGERELCTQAVAARRVTQQHRRRDALAALQWLARRDDVDPRRLALLGWSHGGSTVLAASNRAQPDVDRAAETPAALVAFYPSCIAEGRRGYRPNAPLLLLLGEADDWTPPEPCRALQADAAEPKPRLIAYEGAHHGFDGVAPLRLWREVPGGANPGAGVHVGGSAPAREASRRALLAFLRERLAP